MLTNVLLCLFSMSRLLDPELLYPDVLMDRWPGVLADLVPRTKSASRYGPPGPNPLADLDPRGTISASGFGSPLADLDPPAKTLLLSEKRMSHTLDA